MYPWVAFFEIYWDTRSLPRVSDSYDRLECVWLIMERSLFGELVARQHNIRLVEYKKQ